MSKQSLDELIDDLVPVHRQDEFRAAIVEAVEGLVQFTEFHYGCGKNDEEFIKGHDPKDQCCECYTHKSCTLTPIIEDYKTKLLQAIKEWQ